MNENIKNALKEYDDKNYNQAFELFKIGRNEIKEEEFDRIYSFKFVKTIFESVIKNLSILDKNSKPWIIYLIKTLKNKDIFYIVTVFKIVELLQKNINPDYNKSVIWLEKLDPEFLSIEIKEFETNGKKVKQSSQREKYYSILSKSYEKSGNLKKAREISEKALKDLKEFTNSSDIWFSRRIAEAHIAEEKLPEALCIYKEIMKKKNDWFIQNEVSNIYFQMKNYNESKKLLLDSLLSYGDLDKKVNLFMDFYLKSPTFNLEEQNLNLSALKIYFKIKIDSNWNLTTKDKELAIKYGIQLDKEGLKNVSEKEFLKKCKKLRWDCEDLHTGIIDTIAEKFFFIKVQNGERYYTKSKEYPNRKVPVKGIALKFNLVETFDTKKNKYGYSAINLRFAE
ncbi:MAG: tetratricopeptide repeat protein [Cetobacterium sp.]